MHVSTKWLHWSVLAYIAYLPWSVITKVFLTDKIGIPGIGMIRELLLLIVIILGAWVYSREKKLPQWHLIDMLVGAYMVWGLVLSFIVDAPVAGILAGARFDYEFLIAYCALRLIAPFLPWKVSDYLKVALISIGAAFFTGLLVRFVFGEIILLHFGFSQYLSEWSFQQGVPIYHGIAGAGIRRFQGIWDGPNPAAAAIAVFLGLLFHVYGRSPRHLWWVMMVALVSLMMVFLTYSRSALIAVVLSSILIGLLCIRFFWRSYRSLLIGSFLAFALLAAGFYLRYEVTFTEITVRAGSSDGHKERFITGWGNFLERPMGHGLGYAGPAYRYSISTTRFDSLPQSEKDALEAERIPESWYLQVLQETGFIWGILFLAIVILIFFQALSVSAPLAWSLAVLSAMSVVLHTFESLYVSCLLFALIGLLFGKAWRTSDHPRA